MDEGEFLDARLAVTEAQAQGDAKYGIQR